MRNPFLVYLVACLFAWAPLATLRAVPLSLFLSGSTPAATYTAATAVFDGTNDFIRKETTATGVADANTFTFSCWVDFAGADGAEQVLFSISDSTVVRLSVYRTTGNKLEVYGTSAGGSTRILATGSTDLLAAGGYYHIYTVIDTTTAGDCKMYVNGGANEITITTRDSTSAMDLAPATPRYTVGGSAATTSGSRVNGTLAELVFYDTEVDLVASFRSSSKPADIGATGSTPTGTAPEIYLSRNGSGDSWAVDSSGNSSTFTVTGALTSGTAP